MRIEKHNGRVFRGLEEAERGQVMVTTFGQYVRSLKPSDRDDIGVNSDNT